MDTADCRRAGNDLYHRLHLATYPVAITYIKNEDAIPGSAFRPSANGQKWSLCQAFTYARRWGLLSAMTEKDNFCVPASAMHKWVNVSDSDFIESQVRQGWHKDRRAEEHRFAFAQSIFSGPNGLERLRRMGEYIGFVCGPLPETLVPPDTVLVYGSGGDITHIIHAVCYDFTHPITSSFEGFGESCMKGGWVPFATGRPQVVIPGMGDRAFGGITENEIAIGFPGSMLNVVLENLFKTGGPMNLGQPIRSLLPRLTESMTPGFSYLRKKLDEQKPE